MEAEVDDMMFQRIPKEEFRIQLLGGKRFNHPHELPRLRKRRHPSLGMRWNIMLAEKERR